jgi:hypothetical protein
VVSAIFVSLFIATLFLGSPLVSILIGVVAGGSTAMTVFLIRAYRHLEPGYLATPTEPNARMSLRYLQPNKYPYETPARADGPN